MTMLPGPWRTMTFSTTVLTSFFHTASSVHGTRVFLLSLLVFLCPLSPAALCLVCCRLLGQWGASLRGGLPPCLPPQPWCRGGVEGQGKKVQMGALGSGDTPRIIPLNRGRTTRPLFRGRVCSGQKFSTVRATVRGGPFLVKTLSRALPGNPNHQNMFRVYTTKNPQGTTDMSYPSW